MAQQSMQLQVQQHSLKWANQAMVLMRQQQQQMSRATKVETGMMRTLWSARAAFSLMMATL
jgi:hypothetical protein